MSTFTDQGFKQELSIVFRSLARKHSRVFNLVDALDECSAPRVRSKLLEEIMNVDSHIQTTNLFATSRHIPEINAIFDGKVTREIRATEDDVRRYLENHMADLTLCVRRSQTLQDIIVMEIVKAVDGM